MREKFAAKFPEAGNLEATGCFTISHVVTTRSGLDIDRFPEHFSALKVALPLLKEGFALEPATRWHRPSSRLTFSHTRQIDPQMLAFLVEMASFESKSFCGVGDVVLVTFKFGEDDFPLNLVHTLR